MSLLSDPYLLSSDFVVPVVASTIDPSELSVYRILLIDDDPSVDQTLGRLLRLAGHIVVPAYSGGDALRARSQRFDAALIDLSLGDMYGLDVLHELRIQTPGTRCVVISGDGSCKRVVVAMRLGAHDYLVKPVSEEDVLESLGRTPGATEESSAEPDMSGVKLHSLERWANLVVRAVGLPDDPKTLQLWGRSIGVSQGALRNWCHTAGLSARKSLLFARGLRAVIKHQETGYTPENLLNVVDRRTLTKLLLAAGGTPSNLPEAVGEFLDRQRLIDNHDALAQVRARLRAIGIDEFATGVRYCKQ
jgi:ActR/RegA family two-component response regulator